VFFVIVSETPPNTDIRVSQSGNCSLPIEVQHKPWNLNFDLRIFTQAVVDVE